MVPPSTSLPEVSSRQASIFHTPTKTGETKLKSHTPAPAQPSFLKSTRERYTVIAYGKICLIYLAHHLFRKGVESMQRVVSWFVQNSK